MILRKPVYIEETKLNEEGQPMLDDDGNSVTITKKNYVVTEEFTDFHFLKKELIFTEAVGAIQELYKLYSELKQEFEEYKTTHP